LDQFDSHWISLAQDQIDSAHMVFYVQFTVLSILTDIITVENGLLYCFNCLSS